jgi:hypothetical protein
VSGNHRHSKTNEGNSQGGNKLNTGRIDCGEDFLYYWQDFTPAVSNIVEALDAERFRLAEAPKTRSITIQEFFSLPNLLLIAGMNVNLK